jgi:phosphoribosylformimino-5-aminoimidazole carboxamide ribotide isomerase
MKSGNRLARVLNQAQSNFNMTLFRPCIDLHQGKVKQIVGGTLTDDGGTLVTNFTSEQTADWYARKYAADDLRGGHVIQLGEGNEAAARAALAAFPGGLQIGGGIHAGNAAQWLSAGASHVIVTSWLFSPEGAFLSDRLAELVREVGSDRIVIDLSCRRDPHSGWTVYMNRWQTRTNLPVNAPTLQELADSCAEFLIHAADVEGKRAGMDETLIAALADWSPLPVTYAGGASRFEDLQLTQDLSDGRVDLTIGSALDLFGGSLAYGDCIAWNRQAKLLDEIPFPDPLP